MRYFFLLVLCLGSLNLWAQDFTDTNPATVDLYNDQIRLAELMKTAQEAESGFERNDANYLFIRQLVRTLRSPGAYEFSFDSLYFISILEAPDKAFKIFSWHVRQENGGYRHFGCILMNNADYTLFPLIDNSDALGAGDDSSTSHKSWYGMAYFQFVPEINKYKGTRYYTLIGWDAYEPFSQRKIVDILWFDKQGTPHFGAPLIAHPSGIKHRFIMEYANDVTAQLRYDKSVKQIIFDNLVARNPENVGYGFDDVPDGSTNAFEWKRGKWLYKDNIDLRMPAVKP